MKTTLEPITYTLPAYWASYLINGDDSGISAEDKAQADLFLAREGLPGPVSCSDESWFSWRNDSGNGLGGDVMEFTFLVTPKPANPFKAAHYLKTGERFQAYCDAE